MAIPYEERDLTHKSSTQIEKLRQGILSFINSYKWDYFFTLTFEYSIKNPVIVSGIVEKFINSLSAMAFGSRSKKRVNCFSVAEYHESGSLHVHLLIEDVESRITNPNVLKDFYLPEKVHNAWMSCSSKTGSPSKSASERGKRWFEKVYDQNKVIDYTLKQMEDKVNPVIYDQLVLHGRRK